MLKLLLVAIWMAGDSTMCNYHPQKQYPQQGWGQALAEFMKDPAELHNWAVGGRSAKSFKVEGRWDKMMAEVKPGDYVVVAFGHNDANKAKKERYSTPEDYKEIMRGYAADVKAKGANMIFATSIIHSGGVNVNKETGIVDSVRGGAAGIGPYAKATIELANELNLPCVDLNKLAVDKFTGMKGADVYKLYMRIKPGEYKRLPNGQSDGCHIRDTGAFFYAKGFVDYCYEHKLGVCEFLKDPATVEHKVVGFEGPGSEVKIRDDFSKEEIAYANAPEKKKEIEPWQKEILQLRREGRSKGMSDKEAQAWAAKEYRKRHADDKK